MFVIRFSNSTGSCVFANPGGSSGMEYPLWDVAGYKTLINYITKTFPGYIAGKNLFALPYDWRLDLTAMEQAYEFDRLANRISQAVASNCGKKAVLIGHSMGTIVSLGLMQNPRFQAWRLL
jgi:pimeloyl-ACP methyl ester carboxylesterase